MLWIIALVVCVIEGAKLGGDVAGSWHGSLIGGFVGSVAWVAGLFLLAWMGGQWSGSGYVPQCRNGCCRSYHPDKDDRDFRLKVIERECYWLCKCGDRYQRRGKRFVLINEDGTETPYMIWRAFRGWFPDGG